MKGITDSKAFWIGVLTILFVLYCAAIIHADDNFRGYIEQSYFPLNDEHGIYAETVINAEVPTYKKLYIFAKPTIAWAHGIHSRVRKDSHWVTSLDTGFAYIKEFDTGIGFKINKNWDAKFLYRAHRLPNGYEGDWTGFSIKYSWGE